MTVSPRYGGRMTDKSVLIIPTPKTCVRCLAQMGGYCFASKRDDAQVAETAEELEKIGKPEWCPLRPLPQMREPNEEWLNEYHRDEFADGWNACLKAITGETE